MEIKCTYEKLVDIGSLKGHPRNRNRHSAAQIKRLAKLIDAHGCRHPVIVSNLTGYIVAGHGRLDALKELKQKKVPVDYQDFTDSDAEYQFMISDNAIADWAELDFSGINEDLKDIGPFDIDLLGILDFKIEPMDKYNNDKEKEDEIPEAPKKATSKPGQRWKLGDHLLMCGDATKDSGALLNGMKAELCFTSPPYAEQRDYGGCDLSIDNLKMFINEKNAHTYAVNLGIQRKDNEIIRYWDSYIQRANDCGLKLLSWNIWDRGNAFSIGQQTAMFPIEHEWIFVFGEKRKSLNLTVKNKHSGGKGAVSNRQRDGSLEIKKPTTIRDKRAIGSVVRIDVDRERSINHPAKFPVQLPEEYINACTDSGASVFDPFGGSGSTLIACEKTGRKCYMMELEPIYCDIIINRWEQYTGKKAELLD